MISLSFPPLLSASSSSSSSSLTLLSSRVSPPFFFLFALLHLHLPPFCLSPLLIYIVRLLRPLFAPISLHLTPSSSSPHLTSPPFFSLFLLSHLFIPSPLLLHPSVSVSAFTQRSRTRCQDGLAGSHNSPPTALFVQAALRRPSNPPNGSVSPFCLFPLICHSPR